MEFNVKCLFLQENSMGGKCIIECVTCACVCIYVFLQTSLNSCFLSRYVLNESQSRQNSSSAQGSSSNSGGGSGIPQPPPGMSFYAAKRVIGDNPWTPEQLEQVANTACFPWNLTLHPRPARQVCGSMGPLPPVCLALLCSPPERNGSCSCCCHHIFYLFKPQGKGGVGKALQFS